MHAPRTIFGVFATQALLVFVLSTWALPAAAMPGFFIGKGSTKRVLHTSHVVVMRKGDMSAVSVQADYDGPLDPFAIVLAVPADVTLERVHTLKRDFVDRVEQMSAPRFHEWWEMDPCEPGPAEQEWERRLTASTESNFLGGGNMGGTPTGSEKKVDKELFLKVDTEFKEGEYKFSMLGEGETLEGWAKSKGFTLPQGAAAAVAPYLAQGMKLLLAEVDDKRVELVGGGRGQLSGIRYWSEKPVDKIPTRLSLLSSPGKQELLLYVLHPDQRFEAKNYANVYPPTNIEVDFVVKERMGEFYAALHDMMQAKNQTAFINEYAWHTAGCGEPCANAPLWIHEILTLGGDAFETIVPEEERHPKVPPLTAEEKKALKKEWDELKIPPKERREKEKQLIEERKTVARNKGLLERHKYIVTRLHHRYDNASLPKDPEIGPAGGHVKGGVDLPKGPKGELPTNATSAPVSKLQTRYVFFHPWIGMQKCEKPERYKWGKAPRTYRGLRKIWIAEDLSRRNRTQIKPSAVVKTPIASLGLSGIPDVVPEGGADGGTEGAAEESKCSCAVPGAGRLWPSAMFAALALGAASVRRRRSRHSAV
jgi:MYXO-CTERM domain-containing protein